MKLKVSKDIAKLIKSALKEDIGRKDITTGSLIPKGKFIKAIILNKEEQAVICGLSVTAQVFKSHDRNIIFRPRVKDGQIIKRGDIIAEIYGLANKILTAERVALNFLSLLSGVATKTKKYVDAVRRYKVKILDTRKTMPGLRGLEKYAVRIAGGYNHRFRLDEMILIKDNHIKAIGNKLWVAGLKKIKDKISPRVKIEVEVKNLNEFSNALKIMPDIIMLDNMNISSIKKAVQMRNSLSSKTHLKPLLEASGGISLKNVKRIASAGVDMLSIGALTNAVNSIDMSLKIV